MWNCTTGVNFYLFYLMCHFTVLSGYREWFVMPLVLLVTASFLLHRPHFFVMFSALLAAVLLYNKFTKLAGKLRQARPEIPAMSKIIVTDLQADSLVSFFKPILQIAILQRIQDGIEERIKSDILKSGSVQNPRLLGIKSVLYPMIAAIVAVPAGVVIFFLYHEAFITVLLVPVFLFGFYFATLKIRTADRKNSIEDEFASFAAVASIMESVHVSLFSTFEAVADSASGIFPVMKKEGQRIKNITALGKSPTDALMDLADTHPNESFRDFVQGYISSWNTGGADTAAYLQEQSHRFFKFMQSKMTRYTKQADSIAQIILTVMLLLPMMGLSMMFFATGQMAATMILLLIVVLPFVTVILISFVQIKQPKNIECIRVSPVIFLAGGASAILVYLLRGSVWEAIGAGVVAGSFLNMVLLQKKFTEIADTESPLPEFMRQITRFKNIGADIMHGIQNIRYEASQKNRSKFNDTFDGIIESLYRKMMSGSTLSEAVARTGIRSHNARIVFFILGKIHESGGGTAKTLDDVTRWVTEYADAKKEMIVNLRASLFTAFIGPVLMVMMSVVSNQLAAEFDSSNLAGIGIGLDATADVSGLSEVLTITAVVCMGVVLSKINYFTVQHTTFTGIITAVTMALLYAIPYFPEF